MPRRERRGLLVDALTDAGDHRLRRVPHLPADDDQARRDDADHRGERRAQHAPRLARVVRRDGSPARTSAATSAVVATSIPASCSWRTIAEPLASTATQPRLPHVHSSSDSPVGADVADVAGAAVVAAHQLAAGDDPGADPGRDLHEHEVRDLRPVVAVLPERHRVDVALDQRGRAEALGQPLRDRVVVPARHDRGLAGAVPSSTGPGTPIAVASTSSGARRPPPATRRTSARPSRAPRPGRRRSASARCPRPARRPRGRRSRAARARRRGRRRARRRRAR